MRLEEPTRTKLFAACALLLLTILLSLPVPLHLSTELIGGTADAWQFPWNSYVFRQQVLAGKDPYYTTSIFYPTGTSLALHSYTEFNSAVALLLSPFCNEIAQTNVAMLLATFLTAFGTYLLSYELTKNHVASLFAAIVFAFCPFRMVRMLGQMNFALTQWIPFGITSFLRLMNTGKLRHAVSLALFFVLAHYSNPYYSVYLILILLTLLVCGIAFLPQWRNSVAIRHLFLAGLIASVGLLPPMLRYYSDYGEKALFEINPEELAQRTRVSPLDYVSISTMNPWIEPYVPQVFSKQTRGKVSPGIVGLCTAIVGFILALKGKQKTLLLFASVGILFTVLSFGPYLQFGGHSLILPFGILIRIPFLGHVRLPPRFAIVVALCTALFAGYAISILLKRSTWRVRILVAFLFALLLLELSPVPVHTKPLEISSTLRAIGAKPGATLLSLPYRFDAMASKEICYQIFHKQNLLNGRISRMPLEQVRFFSGMPVARIFEKITSRNFVPDFFVEKDRQSADLFRSIFRVHYVAIFRPKDKITGIDAAILRLFPDAHLLSQENGIVLYELPPIQQDVYELHGQDAGMTFFLYANWRLGDYRGRQRFVSAGTHAKLLMPKIEPGQKLLVTLRFDRQPDAGTIQMRIRDTRLGELHSSNRRNKMEALLTQNQLEHAHQMLTVLFDSPGKVALQSLKIQIK